MQLQNSEFGEPDNPRRNSGQAGSGVRLQTAERRVERLNPRAKPTQFTALPASMFGYDGAIRVAGEQVREPTTAVIRSLPVQAGT